MFRSVAAFHTDCPTPVGLNVVPEIWAENLAGSWNDNAFSIDLTKKIDAAKQYRLRFVPREGVLTGLTSVSLKFHDVAQPSLIKPVRGKADELLVSSAVSTVLRVQEFPVAAAALLFRSSVDTAICVKPSARWMYGD